MHRLESLPHVHIMEPVPYLEFLALMWHSRVVLTDSGGVQEESLTLGVPCITLRENTERPETVQLGDNTLAGLEVEPILRAALPMLEAPQTARKLFLEGNPLGDGRAGERIADIVARAFKDRLPASHKTTGEVGLVVREEVTFPVAINGNSVSAVRALYPKSLIIGVVDHKGRRLIPYHDLPLRDDWKVFMLASKEDQERLKVVTAFTEIS